MRDVSQQSETARGRDGGMSPGRAQARMRALEKLERRFASVCRLLEEIVSQLETARRREMLDRLEEVCGELAALRNAIAARRDPR